MSACSDLQVQVGTAEFDELAKDPVDFKLSLLPLLGTAGAVAVAIIVLPCLQKSWNNEDEFPSPVLLRRPVLLCRYEYFSPRCMQSLLLRPKTCRDQLACGLVTSLLVSRTTTPALGQERFVSSIVYVP